jgi:hypothetical protein
VFLYAVYWANNTNLYTLLKSMPYMKCTVVSLKLEQQQMKL